MLLDLPEEVHELFILMQGVILTTLRGDLGRIGDWSNSAHFTSQQQVAATEQQTDICGRHLSVLNCTDHS